jgi:hypothetical protein
MKQITRGATKLIKVESFDNVLASELSCEVEDFITDHEVKRDQIIKLDFYSAKGEDGYLYHFARLVYENER